MWKKTGEVVTWNSLNWGDGDNPAQISAINYHMVQALRTDLTGKQFENAVEIGAGYGRVTPWLAEFAEKVTAVEPNSDVRKYIDSYYPDIITIDEKVQGLQLDSDRYDLVFTRSVLQHIPEDSIGEAANEINRIADPNATLLLCEETEGVTDQKQLWPRTVDDYAELFDDFDLSKYWTRDAPAKTRNHTRTRMIFE